LLSLAVALAAAPISVLHADQAAVSFDWSHIWNSGGGQGIYGWQFTPKTTIQVTGLGLYDAARITDGGFPGDGLAESHTIAIWSVTTPSTPLLTAALPSGTTAPINSGFRYVDTAPFTLSAGLHYVIAARYADPLAQDVIVGEFNNPSFALTVSPDIQFDGYRAFGPTTTLMFPIGYFPGTLYAFGPNFTYTVVPEPSSLVLWTLASVLLSFVRNPRRPSD
jgi:hypothetical protein